MKKQIFGIIAFMAFILAASPAMAIMAVGPNLSYIYGGAMLNQNVTPPTEATRYGTSGAAFAAFSSQYAGLKTETFEYYANTVINQNVSPLPVADTILGGAGLGFGNITTAGGAGYVGSTNSFQKDYDESPISGSRFYFSNGTPNAAQPKGTFTLNLDVAHHALGFYATDWHDQNGQVFLDISGTDGGNAWSQRIDVLALTGKMGSGSLVYFAFESDLAFDKVVFNASGGDGYGIDNLSVAAPTPIPGAIWLLGSGLIGLVGLRRRSV